jgi:molybdopterin-guanine dinucleotide biosynthesis protein A
MGGGDKALVQLVGRPLVAHAVSRLAPQCAALAISANGELTRFAALDLPPGIPVLPDPLPDGVAPFPGPLAGVLAAMDWAAGLGRPCVVTAAVDTPFLPVDLVTRLRAAAGPDGPAVAASPDAEGRLRRHPTFGLWPVGLRHDLRATLAAGERKLGLWADRQGARIAAFPAVAVDPFFNINTPDDLQRAEALLAGQPRSAP